MLVLHSPDRLLGNFPIILSPTCCWDCYCRITEYKLHYNWCRGGRLASTRMQCLVVRRGEVRWGYLYVYRVTVTIRLQSAAVSAVNTAGSIYLYAFLQVGMAGQPRYFSSQISEILVAPDFLKFSNEMNK